MTSKTIRLLAALSLALTPACAAKKSSKSSAATAPNSSGDAQATTTALGKAEELDETGRVFGLVAGHVEGRELALVEALWRRSADDGG